MGYEMTSGSGSKVFYQAEGARWVVLHGITVCLWRRFYIAIGLGYLGVTCPNALAISAWCIYASAVGPSGAYGRSCSSIWPRMRTTNPDVAPAPELSFRAPRGIPAPFKPPMTLQSLPARAASDGLHPRRSRSNRMHWQGRQSFLCRKVTGEY